MANRWNRDSAGGYGQGMYNQRRGGGYGSGGGGQVSGGGPRQFGPRYKQDNTYYQKQSHNEYGGGQRGVKRAESGRSPAADRREGSMGSSRKTDGAYFGGKKNWPAGKYEVNVPKLMLDMKDASVPQLRHRYKRMYVPSDFFHVDARWQDVFPLHQPMKLGFRSDFHIFSKSVDPLDSMEPDVTEAADANYSFSAKVLLLACPDLADLYRSACRLADEPAQSSGGGGHDKLSATRSLQFLVGTKGKNDPMAIGGPWSPSLDGADPEGNPQVLINTAIRTCRDLTGIDLSACTQWYRFLELHYYRPAERQFPAQAATAAATSTTGEEDKQQHQPEARVETVVIFVPDISTCMPSEDRWAELKKGYGDALQKQLNPPLPDSPVVEVMEEVEEINHQEEEVEEEDSEEVDTEGDPAHHSKLNPNTMKMKDLRHELAVRSLEWKGDKSELIARLAEALDEERVAESKDAAAAAAAEASEDADDKAAKRKSASSTARPKVDKDDLTEKDRRRLERLYQLPERPAIIVHPNRVARSGKFECVALSLHTLLSYRIEDQKEHTFEVSLFAEQFYEMLQRDSAFSIYKAIVLAPERPVEKEEKKDDATKPDEEPNIKRRRVSQSADEEVTKDEGGDKVRRLKRTVDPQLLFAFTFFDVVGAGYIRLHDVEDLLQCLGLNLSRAQMRKLFFKVAHRNDYVDYRELTDKLVVEGSVQDVVTLNCELDDNDYVKELSQGNRALFDEDHGSHAASRTVLTGNGDLFAKWERSEAIRQKVEFQFAQIRDELKKTRRLFTQAHDNQAKLASSNTDLSEKLQAESRLLSDSRQQLSIYRQLVRNSSELMERATLDIQQQFDKEKEEKERVKKEAAAAAAAARAEKEAANVKEEQPQEMETSQNGDSDQPAKSEEKTNEWKVVDAV